MSRRAARAVQADIARAIRAAQQCGAGAVEIMPDGTIRVVVASEFTSQPIDEPESCVELDAKVVL